MHLRILEQMLPIPEVMGRLVASPCYPMMKGLGVKSQDALSQHSGLGVWQPTGRWFVGNELRPLQNQLPSHAIEKFLVLGVNAC